MGPGEPAEGVLGLSSPFTRQLGEWNARPVVLTPFCWKVLTGATSRLVIHEALKFDIGSRAIEQPQGVHTLLLRDGTLRSVTHCVDVLGDGCIKLRARIGAEGLKLFQRKVMVSLARRIYKFPNLTGLVVVHYLVRFGGS